MARVLPAPKLRVEVDFVGNLTFDLIRGSRMLTVAGAESQGITAGLRPLRLLPQELDLRRKIGIVTRAGSYVSPLAERMMTLLEEHRG